jgi:hypothetical protein
MMGRRVGIVIEGLDALGLSALAHKIYHIDQVHGVCRNRE